MDDFAIIKLFDIQQQSKLQINEIQQYIYYQKITQMQQNLTIFKNKQLSVQQSVKQLIKLGQVLQFFENVINKKILNHNDCLLKEQLQELTIIFKYFFKHVKNFHQYFEQFEEFIKQFMKISIKKQQTIQKLTIDLQRQNKTNRLMKAQVSQLNNLISQHVQMSKQKMLQKDEIIKYLSQLLETYLKKLPNQEAFSKVKQLFYQDPKQQINLFQQYNLNIVNMQNIQQKSNIYNSTMEKPDLDIINQQQQSFASNYNSSRKQNINQEKYLPQQKSENYQIQKYHQNQQKIQNYQKKSNSKTKTRFFIEDFRKVISNPLQVLTCQSYHQQQKLHDLSVLSNQSKRSIGESDINQKIIPLNNQTPKIMKFQSNDKINSINKQQKKSKPKNSIFPISSRSYEKQKCLNNITNEIDIKPFQSMKQSNKDTKDYAQNQSNKSKIILQSKNISERSLSIKYLKQRLQNIDLFIGNKLQQISYRGNKVNGYKCGKGRLQYADGLIYEGDFVQNTRKGYGILSKNNVIIYEGNWQEDKFCGKGTLTNIFLINKKKNLKKQNFDMSYTGEFKDNKFHGRGSITQFSQKFYSKFINGIPDGQYSYFDKSGKVQFGIWNNSSKNC